jgi:hypothetical protein
VIARPAAPQDGSITVVRHQPGCQILTAQGQAAYAVSGTVKEVIFDPKPVHRRTEQLNHRANKWARKHELGDTTR